MIIPDGKKTATIILSRMKPSGQEALSSEKSEEELSSSDSSLKVIAEDLLQAFQEGSAHDLMMGLKAFMQEIQVQDEKQDQNMMG